MKRWITMALAAVLCLGLLPGGAMAAEAELPEAPETIETPETRETRKPRPENSCGEDLTWSFSDGTLTVSGSGPMDDFPEGAPWSAHKNEIRSLKLSGSVTSVGEAAFKDYDALQSLDLGDALKEAGKSAFSGCDGLTAVSLPRSFRIFGEESFSHCSNLKEFRFAGGMPSFKLNCLWDTRAKLIYPAANPWPLEHIEQLESAFQGRIEFLSSDGTDPYTPEAEKPQTQPPTEEPTAAPTTAEPATEAPAEPVTRPTEAPTEPETLPAPTEETRPPVPELPDEEFVELPEEKESGSILMPVLIALMVLSLAGIIAVAVILVRSREKRIEEDLEQDLRGPQIPRHPAPEKPARTPREKQPAPGETSPRKPTQAEKEARKTDHKKDGKFRR